jgi:type IV secretion system protein VirD4
MVPVSVIFLVSCFVARIGKRSTASHGSARFAYLQELGEYSAPPAPPNHKLILGLYGQQLMSLSQRQQEQHVLIVGPTGRGKSSGIIIPGLLCEQGTRSLFVLDLKEELLKVTGGAVAQEHDIWLFAPAQPNRSMVYNPLRFINSQEEAQRFARLWITNTGESREEFWDRTAELLIVATILHLREVEPDAPFARLADVLGMSFKQLQTLLINSRSRQARSLAEPLLDDLSLNERLAIGILTGLKSRFFLLRDPIIRAATGRPGAGQQEIDFLTLLRDPRPRALFFSSPASEAQRLKPLVSVMIAQLMSAAIREAEQHGGQLLRPLTFYLDDLPAAGRIVDFEQYIATLRSRRIALIFAIQNFSQLDEVYGRARRPTIITNANTHVVLSGTGQEEADFYSRRLGDMTAIARNSSVHLSPDFRISNSWSRQETRRPLMTPDEIRRMPERDMLIVAESTPAFVTWNARYWEQPNLVGRANLPY